MSLSEKNIHRKNNCSKKNYTYSEILVTFFLNVDMYIGYIYIFILFFSTDKPLNNTYDVKFLTRGK
jgi:hypothetical protein